MVNFRFMKPKRQRSDRMLRWCICLACGFLVRIASAAAPTNAPAPVASAALDVEAGFPKSVFDERDGKDPFFPNRVVVPLVNNNAKPPADTSRLLVLMGISGTVGKPLAIINGYTLENGELRDVTTSSGRLKIRCVEIRKDTVLIEVIDTGERRELRLKSGQ